MSPITRWHGMTTWHDHKQFTRTILRAGHEISENQFLICCLLVTPILLSAKTKVNEIKTSFFYQTPDFRKSLIELILVCIYRIPSLTQAHASYPECQGPWHDHDCDDMTSESWWSVTVMASWHAVTWMSHRREQIMASHGYQWSPSPSAPHNWWSSAPDAGILSGIEDQLRVR